MLSLKDRLGDVSIDNALHARRLRGADVIGVYPAQVH